MRLRLGQILPQHICCAWNIERFFMKAEPNAMIIQFWFHIRPNIIGPGKEFRTSGSVSEDMRLMLTLESRTQVGGR